MEAAFWMLTFGIFVIFLRVAGEAGKALAHSSPKDYDLEKMYVEITRKTRFIQVHFGVQVAVVAVYFYLKQDLASAWVMLTLLAPLLTIWMFTHSMRWHSPNYRVKQ